MHKFLSNKQIYHFAIICTILLYFFIEFYFIFIYQDLYPKFKVFETYYELIGDSKNQTRYEQAYNMASLLYISRSIIFLVFTSVLTIFKRHQSFEKFKSYPSVIKDYKTDIKFTEIAFLQMFTIWLVLFNMNSDLSQMNSWPIIKHINLDIDQVVINKSFLFIVIAIPVGILVELISKRVTHNVGKRIKVIEKQYVSDDHSQHNELEQDHIHLDEQDSIISKKDDHLTFLTLFNRMLYVTFIFLLGFTLYRFYDFHTSEYPEQLLINKDFTLYDDFRENEVELCEMRSVTISCNMPYDYEDTFNHYDLSEIELTIYDPALIEQLEQSTAYFTQSIHYKDIRIDQERLTVKNNTIHINLIDPLEDDVSDLYLRLNSGNQYNKEDEPIIKNYRLTLKRNN